MLPLKIAGEIGIVPPPRPLAPSSSEPRSELAKPGKQTHFRKRILLLSVLLIACVSVAAFFYFRNQQASEYVTAPIDRGDIESTVGTTGNLNAVRTVQVGSQVSGNIKALYADFNTKVKKGQLLALIDPAPFEAAVNQAKAALNSAKASVLTAQGALAKSQSDLTSALANVASQQANVVKAQSVANLAKLEVDRRSVLISQGATSQEDYDTSKANSEQAVASVDAARAALNASEASAESARKGVDVARAQLQQMEADAQQDAASLSQVQLNLDHTRILAPVEGTVQSRNMDVGQTVAASFQAPTIFVIAQDLTKMQVDTNVGEADVAAIRLGQKANFTVDAYPGQVFSGAVWQIRQAPINVQNVITYDVVIAVSNPDLKLFPGMTANVTILTNRVFDVLRIPKAALRFRPRTAGTVANQRSKAPIQSGNQQPQTLYVLRDGKPTALPVKLGISDQNYVQLLEGNLQENAEVVTGQKTTAATPAPRPQSGGTKRIGI